MTDLDADSVSKIRLMIASGYEAGYVTAANLHMPGRASGGKAAVRRSRKIMEGCERAKKQYMKELDDGLGIPPEPEDLVMPHEA